jgi:hypothetical protein
MSEVTIYISKQGKGTGLVLSDSEGHTGNNTITTIVNPGDKVIWQLKMKGGIDTLTAITEKAGSEDIFSKGPASTDSGNPSSNWQGVVSKSATGTESYSIGYTIDGVSYTDDPELELKHGG